MKRKKIMLVDDAKAILMLEQQILEDYPFDIVTANDGAEAVSRVKSEKPDLILLDVNMPKMDGYEVCQQIRAQEETQDIPIIMVTTRDEEDSMETGYINGATDYITKPIDETELLTKVKDVLGD